MGGSETCFLCIPDPPTNISERLVTVFGLKIPIICQLAQIFLSVPVQKLSNSWEIMARKTLRLQFFLPSFLLLDPRSEVGKFRIF
jgi:hypothetical protein